MGASQSLDIPGGGYEGYHVIKVQENSPGSKAGLEPYFDYIVAANNTRLNEINDDLKDILKSHIDKPLVLTVYNSKRQNVRSLNIVPTNNWDGQGLLGVSIRFASFENANENVWHILNISQSSPAEKAGLISNTDYIVGADSFLQDNDDIFNLIKSYDGKELRLFVYNSQTDKCREVTIVPNSNWGGSGLLGCDIGYGYLHRIPKCDDQTLSTNVNAKSDDPSFKNNLVPTTIQNPSVTNFSEITANPLLGTPSAPEMNINSGNSSNNFKFSSIVPPSGSILSGDVSNSSLSNQSNPLTTMTTVDSGVALSSSNDSMISRFPTTSSVTSSGSILATSRPSLQAAPPPTVSFPPPMLSKPPSTFYFTPSPLYNNSSQQTSPGVCTRSLNPETVQTTIGNPNIQLPNMADLSLRPSYRLPPTASVNTSNFQENLAKNDSVQYFGNTFSANNTSQSKLPTSGTFSQPISSSNTTVLPPPPPSGFYPPSTTNFSNVPISQSFSAPGTVPGSFKPIASGPYIPPFNNYARVGGDASFPNITLYNPLNPPVPADLTTSSSVNTSFSSTTIHDKSQPTSFSSLGPSPPPPPPTSMPPSQNLLSQ